MRKLLMAGVFLWVSLFISTGLFASVKKQPPSGDKTTTEEMEAVKKPEGPYITLKVPLTSDTFSGLPVAIVNDEQITVADLNNALQTAHGGMSADKKEAAKVDYSEILKRIINVKLIVREAKSIGIDEMPEIKKIVDDYSKAALRELLQKQYVKNVKADEKEVEKIYKEMVKEWKVKSVLFEKEDDAKNFEEKIKAGGNFNEVVREALAAGTAKGGEEGVYLKNKDLLPNIATALRDMKIDSVSSVVRVESGHVIFRLEDIGFPENPEAREQAQQKALNTKRVEVLTKYNKELSKKYTKLNKNIFNSLDFSSENIDIEKLMKDKRVIAEIKGDKPITVGELTEAIVSKYYHGVDSTIKGAKGKKLNERKIGIMQELLGKKMLRLEALKKGIHKTEEYKKDVKDYEDSMIFGAFMQKVVFPDIKLNEDEVKAYYKDHLREFTYPEMISINSLVFSKVSDAESVIDKLRKGADFNWVKANADGQVDKGTKDLLSFDGTTITKSELPPEVQKTLSGVRGGDLRLHAGADGYFYVLYIQNVIPSSEQPFEEVSGMISKKVFNEKINKSVDDWGNKLKESGAVKIYLAGSEK